MPYIPKSRRKCYDKEIESLVVELYFAEDCGYLESDITYVIYRLVKEMFGKEGFKWKDKVKALEVLEAVKLEYYRRVIVPYEDKKIKEHGEI